ncbi:MAG: aldo/keto reductase [Ruminococcaceae bacterium]|nr:aldo/keto reductase [Oscillospiraceae bacterium]
MDYRKIGKESLKTSIFGFGCMRFPLLKQADGSTDYGMIDEPEAIRMIRYAIDNGLNYLDSGYGYHHGNSEKVIGKALQDGYRDKVLLATKLPVWQTKKYEDFDRILDEQLSRLQTDTVDFYLLHALNEQNWHKVKDLGVLDFLEKARQSGKIRHIGFSFHDQLSVFKEIIDSYDWDICQIQLNLLDDHYQAGLEGMFYAAENNISVVVMEPLRGGALASQIPADIQDIWDQAVIKRSPAEWAFRWLSDFPQVSVILSGVSTMEQLQDNIRIFADAKPFSLTKHDKALIEQVQTSYRKKIKVGCTGCNYCMPCPSGVAIPDVFSIYNHAYLFDDMANSKKKYRDLIKQKKDAGRCVSCGRCEPLCPQNIPIIEKLAEAHKVLTASDPVD